MRFDVFPVVDAYVYMRVVLLGAHGDWSIINKGRRDENEFPCL